MTQHLRLSRLAFAATLLTATAANSVKADPTIIPRGDWGARDARVPVDDKGRPIREVKSKTHPIVVEKRLVPRKAAVYLTVHHSEIEVGEEQLSAEPKNALHKFQESMQDGYQIDIEDKRGKKIGYKTIYMIDVPYHYIISPHGVILEGRDLKFAARSNTEYDMPISQHITVRVDGDFRKQQPREKQVIALTELLYTLAKKHNISVNNIVYHSMVADSDCPGKHMIERIPAIRSELSSRGIAGDPAGKCDGCNADRIKKLKKELGRENI